MSQWLDKTDPLESTARWYFKRSSIFRRISLRHAREKATTFLERFERENVCHQHRRGWL